MLTVVMTSMPASSSSSMSCQRFSLPRARHVGVRQLVDQRYRGARARTASRSISVNVGSPVLDLPPRDDLQALEHRGGLRPTVGLDEADNDVGAALVRAAGPRPSMS